MKIALTGATSFTGAWFRKALVEKGHEVISLVQKSPETYQGLKRERLSLHDLNGMEVSGPFGSESFIKCLKNQKSIDLFCHHAAEVTDYKSPQFDAIGALQKNTFNLSEVLKVLKDKGCQKFVLTGSVFAQKEGVGSSQEDSLRAFSPYGLSKGLTEAYYDYACFSEKIPLKKFIIPNPFGPLEEMRFTSFVAKNWLKGDRATLTHPDYVRDNVPVTLLAKAYAAFVENDQEKINPSFYAGSQKEFTLLFQKEMLKRLNVPCELIIMDQVDFSEPRFRLNKDKMDPSALDWNEEQFWDTLASFYLQNFGALHV